MLDKSSKRRGKLNKYFDICNQEYQGVLKHPCVRWLSLECYMGKITKNFDSLKSCFLCKDWLDKNSNSCMNGLLIPFWKLTCCFKHQPFKRQPHLMVKHTQKIFIVGFFIVWVFDHFVGLTLKGLKHFNLLLQREQPCIHILKSATEGLGRKRANRIMEVDQ